MNVLLLPSPTRILGSPKIRPHKAFREGIHLSADLFANFEDWRMGTFGWTLAGAPDPRAADDSNSGVWWGEEEESIKISPRGAHFDPRNFTSLGPRISVEVSGVHRQRAIGIDYTERPTRSSLVKECVKCSMRFLAKVYMLFVRYQVTTALLSRGLCESRRNMPMAREGVV